MGNGRPNLLREVERIVLLLESGEWTDTGPKHPLAMRLQDALDDLHDDAREAPAAVASGPKAHAGVTVWVGNVTSTRMIDKGLFENARIDMMAQNFDACRREIDALKGAPAAAVADDEDIIADIIANHAFHDSEHGKAAMDKWQMRDAAKDILAHFAAAPQSSGNPGPLAAVDLPDAVRVPLDSLHADAGYLIGRVIDGTMSRDVATGVIRSRIDAAIAASKEGAKP